MMMMTPAHPWRRWVQALLFVLLLVTLWAGARNGEPMRFSWPLLIAGIVVGIVLDFTLSATWAWVRGRRAARKGK